MKPRAKTPSPSAKKTSARALYLYAISQVPETDAPAVVAEGIDGEAPVEAIRCENYPCWISRAPNIEFADKLPDHVLNSGVVIHGSLVISLAGVDLVYVGLNVVLTSVETALRNLDARSPASPGL